MAQLSSESGRRGNWRWRYGTHGWVPESQFDFSRGMIRDVVQTDLPPGALYDVSDYLVHQQGSLVKRGSTVYAGPTMTSASSAAAVAYAEYPAGSKLVAVGDNGHIYTITSGTTTDVGGSTVTTIDTPKFRIGGTKNLLVFPVSDGTTSPIKYDGSAAPASLGGTPAAGKFCAVYKSRLALGGSSSTPQRVYFSPTPDIESTWDTTNAWIDFDYPITGMCALQNALLVFSAGHTERLIGSTPPPNTDMDRQPVGDIGCLDARSIAVWNGNCVFANGRGVYMTNGSTFVSLTGGQHGNDGIASYWQRTVMSGYTPGTTVIAGGIYRDFYIVYVNATNPTIFMCHIPTRAWTRLSTFQPKMFATAVGTTDELYYADGATNRVGKLSDIFVNLIQSGLDADGTAISPTFTTKAFGGGMSNLAFGDVHITSFYQDVSPTAGSDLVVYKQEYITTTQTSLGTISPTANVSSTIERQRLSLNVDAPAMSLFVAQGGASAQTIILGVEVDTRPYPYPTEGPTT